MTHVRSFTEWRIVSAGGHQSAKVSSVVVGFKRFYMFHRSTCMQRYLLCKYSIWTHLFANQADTDREIQIYTEIHHTISCITRHIVVELGRQVTNILCSGIKTVIMQSSQLTPSTPGVPNCCCSKGPAPYWSNLHFLIFDIRALWRSGLSARAPECEKLKIVG